MLANVKTEDFYYSEDEIKQVAMNFGLRALLEKMALNHDGYILYITDDHFYHGLTERHVMTFIRHSKDENVWLAAQAYPNFYAYDTSMPYESLYTKEDTDVCYGGQVFPKWTRVDTDPFLIKAFDTRDQILRKSEVNRILGEFVRNVKLHLQKGKIAQIKEAADQYSG